MFFQMAAHRDPMAEVRAFLQRNEANRNRPLTPEEVRSAAAGLLGTNRRSPGPGLVVTREDMDRRYQERFSEPPLTGERPGNPAAQPGLTSGQAKPPSSQEVEAGHRILIEKLRRGGGLNGYGYLAPDDDVNLLTRAGYSEFGRESNWPDLHAGIWAILNRVRPAGGYGRHRNELGPTLEEVLTRQQPNGVQQFPFMPRGGINAPGGSAAWQRSANPEQMNPRERKAWELTLQAVKDVISGGYPDPTAGASFYYNRTFAPPDRPPGWWGTLRRSPYRSPNNENFFGQASEEPERPLLLGKPSPYSNRRAVR